MQAILVFSQEVKYNSPEFQWTLWMGFFPLIHQNVLTGRKSPPVNSNFPQGSEPCLSL